MTAFPGITYVIPCGGAKLDRPAPARDLYQGSLFRHALRSVLKCIELDEQAGLGKGRVLILSAKYGLVQLDDVIEPYDLTMGQAGSVSVATLQAQAVELGMVPDDFDLPTPGVYAFLPKPYLRRLDEAMRELYVYVQDVYEGCGGNGDQRHVLSVVARPVGVIPTDEPADGLRVWIGADTSGFAWGVPILVSYGRMRRLKTLPVASAPWVEDSRAFTELVEHGRWTIPAEVYAADVQRHQRIGGLVWAGVQDWPCAPDALAATGLSVAEHQRRSTQSRVELGALAPGVPWLWTLQGDTPESYVRHLRQCEAAGLDLAAERLPIGVGGLVGRPVGEVAAIVRALWAAGVRRMHGFGVKGPVLRQVGHLFESIDSAAWSAALRYAHRGGGPQLCGPGLVTYEWNCPMAAEVWAKKQRSLASYRDGIDIDTLMIAEMWVAA